MISMCLQHRRGSGPALGALCSGPGIYPAGSARGASLAATARELGAPTNPTTKSHTTPSTGTALHSQVLAGGLDVYSVMAWHQCA